MKIYKFNKISILFQLLFIVLLILGWVYWKYTTNSPRFFYEVTFLIIFLVMCIPFIGAMFKRKIILDDENITFISFFNSIYTSKSERDFSVKYANVKSIEAKKSWLPKLISLKVMVKNRSKPVFIEYTFINHKELYNELCNSVKRNNPEAYIETSIYSYCQDK